jgi:hypothetical protein
MTPGMLVSSKAEDADGSGGVGLVQLTHDWGRMDSGTP